MASFKVQRCVRIEMAPDFEIILFVVGSSIQHVLTQLALPAKCHKSKPAVRIGKMCARLIILGPFIFVVHG